MNITVFASVHLALHSHVSHVIWAYIDTAHVVDSSHTKNTELVESTFYANCKASLLFALGEDITSSFVVAHCLHKTQK